MNLEESRKEIEELDRELAELLERRMRVSGQIASCKKELDLPVQDPERERALINRLASEADPELERCLRTLYATVFSVSRSYQNKLLMKASRLSEKLEAALQQPVRPFPERATVACQGIEGAFSQIACEKMFRYPNILYFKTYDAVFKAIDQGLCDFGVLPIENSTAGSVNDVYNLLNQYHFYIVKSARIHVKHALVASKQTRIGDIKEVLSHELAFSQCSAFLNSLDGVCLTPCLNTAIAAELVARSDRTDLAAIASESAASLYNLQILRHQIQNGENNHTRFICISKNLDIYPGADKSSLILKLPHKPGSLYAVIERIQALGMNLSKLESRPIPGTDFEYMFYLDVDASVYAPELRQLLCELERDVGSFRYLGSYLEMP